jgi:hypothetical protein
MADKIPTFWVVWTAGMDRPELVLSEGAAVNRAYELALSQIGMTVHVLQTQSVGTIQYPANPTATGILAKDPPRIGGS